MSQTSNFNSRKRKSNLVSFKLEDIQLQTENGEVADVTVNLDYIDRLKPSEFRNVVLIANNIKHYLTNYSNNSNDFFEVINRNLTTELLNDENIGLSEVLDSLSVNLDVSPKVIPFQFDNTNSRTSDGDINDIVSFQLKDIQLDVTNTENADVTVTLDYINGVKPSEFKEVQVIADRVKDYLTNYPNNKNDLFEVINRNLTSELLTDKNLGLSEVLDSLSVKLDVAPAIIHIVSFQLEDILLPIDGASIADVTINLDYIDGIDPGALKDVIPLGNFIENYLKNYFNPNDSFEIVNNKLANALLTDSNFGLSKVLDSLTVKLDVSPGVIPFQFDNTVTLTQNILTGSSGKDDFALSSTNINTITNFVAGEDRLILSKSQFGFDENFSFAVANTEQQAAISNAVITYVPSSGSLFWNQNANSEGFVKGQLIANLPIGTQLTNSNFLLTEKIYA
jgi:hypothetical protein